MEEIANRVGKVDFLATQFSYASRLGNKEDVAARRAQAREVMDRLLMQIEVFRPSYVMPFASFVWFCHEENQYLNFEMNKIGDVAREIREKSKAIPVVLYPGDTWHLNEEPHCDTAIKKYEQDFAALFGPNPERLQRTRTVSSEDLVTESRKFIDSIDRRGNRYLIRLFLANAFFRHRWRRSGRASVWRVPSLLTLIEYFSLRRRMDFGYELDLSTFVDGTRAWIGRRFAEEA